MTALLAFDTSTEVLALALHAAGRDHAVNQPGGAQASAALLPSIHALLAGAGLALPDLDAIAFGAGPGAFTGLRTSCAVAQGLAFGLDVPLLPIDSLLLVADDACGGGDGQDVAVAMDARMGEVYGARYRRRSGGWQTLLAPALYPLPALSRLWLPAPPDRVAGSALVVFGDRLALPAGVRRIDAETSRAAALLRLARAAFDAGAGIDAAEAAPVYLRDKVALTTEERALARAAS